VPAGAEAGIVSVKGDVGKTFDVTSVNPAEREAASQAIEYLSGVPVVVKGIDAFELPKHIVGDCGDIVTAVLKSHPLLP